MEKAISNTDTSIFLSYCSADNHDINRIDNLFLRFNIKVTRDIRDLAYNADIHKFMDKVKTHDKIILYVSDSYLKSVNCMYEGAQVLDMQDRVIIILKKGTKLFGVDDKKNLISYWEEKMDNILQSDPVQFQSEIADTRLAQQSIAKFIDFVIDNKRMDDENLEFETLLDSLQVQKKYPTIINKYVYSWIVKSPKAKLFDVLTLVGDLYKSKTIELSEFPNIPIYETFFFFKGIQFEPERNGITLRLTVTDRNNGREDVIAVAHLVGIAENSMRSRYHSKFYFYCENPAKKQRYMELKTMDYKSLNDADKRILLEGYEDVYRAIIHFE